MEIAYDGGCRFIVRSRGHEVAIDTPQDAGGADTGITPTELFASSLGACVAQFALAYFCKHALDPDGLRVEVDYDTAEAPYRVTRVTSTVIVRSDLSDEHLRGLTANVNACYLHRQLSHEIDAPILILREEME